MKYRVSGGLAMTPDKDMNMLKRMSQQGWHVTGMKFIFYCFEKGKPHDYDYSLNLERSINAEMISFYEASGWNPVIAVDGCQIYRAEAGTSDIFSDLDSEIEMLSKNRRFAGKGAAIFAAMLVFCIALNLFTKWNIASFVLTLCVQSCFIIFLLSFIGFSISLFKKGES